MAAPRSPALAVLALLLGIVVLLLARSLWTPGTAEATGPASEPQPLVSPSAAALDVPERPRAPDSPAPPERNEVESREPAPAPEPAAAPPARTCTVSGELVLLDLDGTERRGLDGSMDLLLWQGNRGSHVAVDVIEGRWRATLTESPDGDFRPSSDARLRIDDPSVVSIGVQGPRVAGIDGPLVFEEPEQRFRFGRDDVVVIVRRVPGVTLAVEDALTGVGLADVRVLRIDDWRRNDHEHPGDLAGARVLAEGAVSPVALVPTQRDAQRGVGNCFVHAPGFAWGTVELDFARGGERRVQLVAGGDLEVTLARAEGVSGDLRLRVRRAGETSRPFCEADLAGARRGEPLVLGGLPVGAYELTAEVGDWWSDPLVLARGSVDVRAGEVGHLTLAIEAAPELVRAPLSGRLLLSPAWEIERPMLVLELLDTPLDGTDGRHRFHAASLRDRGEGVWEFDAGPVQTGRYELGLFQLEYAIVFELGPQGRSDVVLDVPPPVEVSVFVRDESTGGPADVERLLWNCRRPEGVTGGGLKSADRVPGEDRFVLHVPRGEIDLRTRGDGWTNVSRSVFAEDGLEVVIDVRPAASALLRLLDGDTPVPWPEGSMFGRFEAVGGKGRPVSTGQRDGGLRVTLSEPGRYRMQVPDVDGYEPCEPVEFDVREGETTEVVVRLVRIP